VSPLLDCPDLAGINHSTSSSPGEPTQHNKPIYIMKYHRVSFNPTTMADDSASDAQKKLYSQQVFAHTLRQWDLLRRSMPQPPQADQFHPSSPSPSSLTIPPPPPPKSQNKFMCRRLRLHKHKYRHQEKGQEANTDTSGQRFLLPS
jgi:hypothetical protein